MLTIHLSKLQFHALHGVYPVEALTGNDFEVDVDVKYDESGMDLTDIDAMINYERLFSIVHNRMNVPTALLETVANDIAAEVIAAYPYVSALKVSIMKLNAPISHLRGRVGVTLEKSF
jgi:dihydroneopterin aldolase